MPLELVTGHAGEDHVSSSDAGRLHAGIFGAGTLRLPVAGMMEATSTDSTVTVETGDVMMQGRHITLTEPQTWNIQPAAAGLYRTDAITIDYRKDAGGVELAEFGYIIGPETADPDLSPEYADSGDIIGGDVSASAVLCTVKVSSAGVTSVEQRLAVAGGLSSADYAQGAAVAWATSPHTFGDVKAVRYGKVAMLAINVQLGAPIEAHAAAQLGTLAPGWRPALNAPASIAVGADAWGNVQLAPNGIIQMRPMILTGGFVPIRATYILA